MIGGGVIGSSIAYQLSRRKIGVVLLEKRGVVGRTSSACEGTVFLQSKNPGTHLKLALESAERFSHLEEELRADIEYRNNGGMVIIETEEELRTLKCFVAKQRRIGLDVALITREEALAMEPYLSKHILASTYSRVDAQVNPIALTFAFINAAKRKGAKIIAGTEVLGIGVKSDKICSVKTDKGEIQTKTVVNAAGAFAGLIGRMVHLQIPIKPRRGQILVTEAVPPLMRRTILSAQYIGAKYDPAIAEIGGGGISVEQTLNGNFLIGSTREFVGFDQGTTHLGMKHIARQISRIVPVTANLNIIRTFAGLRPHTPDGLPILGPVSGLEGFVVAAGHEGDGIALSPITGEIIAGLIVDKNPKIDLKEFSLERFYS